MDKIKMAFQIIQILQENCFEAYIVGGAVRDYLLGQVPVDIDIATNAQPKEIETIFLDSDLTAAVFGSVRINFQGACFEVTTYRKDISYQDHRHPQIEYVKTLEEDLARRDFTVNAMAMTPTYQIIDIFSGTLDLKKKNLNTIGPAEKSFEEDGLRVLRALYFCSKLDFRLDQSIVNTLSADYLSHLPKECIKSMLEKIIRMPFINGLQYIVDYKILKNFFFYQELAEIALKYLARSEDIYILYYCLHQNLPDDERITNVQKKRALTIAPLILKHFNAVVLYESKGKNLEEAVRIYSYIYGEKVKEEDVLRQYQLLPIHGPKDLNVNYIELVEPALRSVKLKVLERAVLQGNVKNKKEDLIKLLKK